MLFLLYHCTGVTRPAAHYRKGKKLLHEYGSIRLCIQCSIKLRLSALTDQGANTVTFQQHIGR